MCKSRQDFVFTNDEVKAICAKLKFGNPFDATKIDSSSGLPDSLIEDDAFIVHLGREGDVTRHQFVFGIENGYHRFEPIPENRRIPWTYRPSILNNINTSESNTLSIGYNQLIMQDFLYEDISASPKIYISNRTQMLLHYFVDDDEVNAARVQIEIDLTLEHMGRVSVFEAKNGNLRDFNVFQLFNPFRYYLQTVDELDESSIDCCYLLRSKNRLRLYLYRFTAPQNPGSITLIRNAEYTLVER